MTWPYMFASNDLFDAKLLKSFHFEMWNRVLWFKFICKYTSCLLQPSSWLKKS